MFHEHSAYLTYIDFLLQAWQRGSGAPAETSTGDHLRLGSRETGFHAEVGSPIPCLGEKDQGRLLKRRNAPNGSQGHCHALEVEAQDENEWAVVVWRKGQLQRDAAAGKMRRLDNSPGSIMPASQEGQQLKSCSASGRER